MGLSVALFISALLAGGRGDPERLIGLLSASEQIRASVGAMLMTFMSTRLARHLAEARTSLGHGAVDSLWEKGRLLPLDASVADALSELDDHR